MPHPLPIPAALFSRLSHVNLRFCLLTILFVLVATGQPATASRSDRTLKIAVASNFKSTLQDLAAVFEANTNVRVRISSASTGILYAQIRSGAPFDLFFAADVLRPKLLVEDNHAIAHTRFTYALGQLVLWAPGRATVNQDVFKETRGRISIANPETAPYGLAARQYLQNVNLWEELETRLVYGANVAQTVQHLVSGNAQLGLASLSLFMEYRSSVKAGEVGPEFWMVPVHLYAPIEQQGVLLSRSTNPALAEEFIDFMKSVIGRDVISRNGYLLPSRKGRP
jgi:molybdate transport system substrate-binding protein